MHPKELKIEDFDYNLPQERIPAYPLSVRDQSKLLLYKNGILGETVFREIGSELPSGSILYMNDTRVIPARLLFQKSTGAQIEIFCLSPEGLEHESAMMARGSVLWRCLVGGLKKWKEGSLERRLHSDLGDITVIATKVAIENDEVIIRFDWSNQDRTFADIIGAIGEIPLPPYMNRHADPEDYDRYQTVIAAADGSVASPTAALHFTSTLLSSLHEAGFEQRKITLHVGAGTFRPVQASSMGGHDMHAEVFHVSLQSIEQLIQDLNNQKKIICVGTTTTRTLESLYWIGVKFSLNKYAQGDPILLNQWECYELPSTITPVESLTLILDYLRKNGHSHLGGATALMIAPGYQWKILRGIITNFHMPKSTLILLVAGLVGEKWREIYQYALANNFRFLSYGDSSLLLP
jgi:S-adenosylmethionine:tRNA ribosyltransferase-isomerase